MHLLTTNKATGSQGVCIIAKIQWQQFESGYENFEQSYQEINYITHGSEVVQVIENRLVNNDVHS